MNAPTPGPLTVEDDGHLAHPGAFWINSVDGEVVAELTGGNAEADAALFAGASALMEAAERVISVMREDGDACQCDDGLPPCPFCSLSVALGRIRE